LNVSSDRGSLRLKSTRQLALQFVPRVAPPSCDVRACSALHENSPTLHVSTHTVTHVHIAARVAIADSILRPGRRGFPMLIGRGRCHLRKAPSAGAGLPWTDPTNAYAHARRAPCRYFGERETRLLKRRTSMTNTSATAGRTAKVGFLRGPLPGALWTRSTAESEVGRKQYGDASNPELQKRRRPFTHF